jgi:hypothetical protein
MPDELKSLLSIQEASSSVPLFLTAGVQLHYIHGSRAQSLYPDGERTAYATASVAGQQHSTVSARTQQPYEGPFCLAPTLVDHRAPSSVASSPVASQHVHTDHSGVEIEDDLEDDKAFVHAARAAQGMQGVKARWNSPI